MIATRYTTALRSPGPWRVLLPFLLAAICWLAFTPDPPPSVGTGWDKFNHVLAFAAVAVCGWFAWGRHRNRAAGVVLGAMVFGVFIEVVQALIPGRTGEWPDLLADALGIAAGLALAAALTRSGLTP